MNFLDQPGGWIIVASIGAVVMVDLLVAAYGSELGYPFFPLLVAILLLGPFGPGLVLLAVTLGPGPRRAP